MNDAFISMMPCSKNSINHFDDWWFQPTGYQTEQNEIWSIFITRYQVGLKCRFKRSREDTDGLYCEIRKTEWWTNSGT